MWSGSVVCCALGMSRLGSVSWVCVSVCGLVPWCEFVTRVCGVGLWSLSVDFLSLSEDLLSLSVDRWCITMCKILTDVRLLPRLMAKTFSCSTSRCKILSFSGESLSGCGRMVRNRKASAFPS